MKKTIISVGFCAVGLINFLPIVGMGSADTLAKLYGIAPPTGDLLLLLRHRALLFGVLGGLLLVAAFRPTLQYAIGIAALISMLGFVVFGWSSGTSNPAITRIVLIDIVASIGLVAVMLLMGRSEIPDPSSTD